MTSQTTTREATTTPTSRYRLPAGLASLVVGGVLMTASMPEPKEGMAGPPLRRFYEDNLAATEVAVLLGAVSVVAMILAVAFVRRLLIDVAADGHLVDIVTIAGTLTVVWLWLSTATGAIVPLMADDRGRFPSYTDQALADVDLFSRLSEAWGDIGMGSVGLYIGAASLAAIRSGAFPRWIGGVGLVIAAAALISLVGAVWTPAPVTVLFFVGLFGFVLWNLAVGVALCVSGWRGRWSRRAEAAAA